MLIKEVADLSSSNMSRNTLLHMAAARGDIDIAKMLLDAGANADQCNSFKQTALDLAKQYRHSDIIELFEN